MEPFGIDREIARQQLQCDRTIELRVARAIHLAHTARANPRVDRVGADHATRYDPRARVSSSWPPSRQNACGPATACGRGRRGVDTTRSRAPSSAVCPRALAAHVVMREAMQFVVKSRDER